MSDELNAAESSKTQEPIERPVVVGIGASAGGLEAISRLLRGVPRDSGMSFVLIQHLDPTHASALVEILARRTPLPIREVESDTEVEPDHIYVIPPGQYLAIDDGVLKLRKPQDPRGSRMAIDYFLTSLAEDACEFGIGVVLSGTGSDGTAGLQEIKHYGGLTVVQEPDEAGHTGMPQSAIDAVHVDYVLPAEEIGSQLKRYVEFCQSHGPLSAQSVAQAEQSNLSPILELMRKEVKHDFRRYRKNTLMRRIRRRMGLHQLDQLADYQALLSDSAKERDALRCDLLIGVTRFFRNPDAWEVLAREVVRPMLDPELASPIRVWCAGCATGEEAYSIAMLLLERASVDRRKLVFQIFATDVAEDALLFARKGLYPEAIMKDVPIERLQRFFKKESDGYRVSKQLRESVVFANQNVLAQPPFAKLDLILCRNLLIYLQGQAQERVMNVFQFALKAGGTLFLGSSESVGQSSDLFVPISKKHRIYRRNQRRAWRHAGSDHAANIQPLPEFSARERKVRRNQHHTSGIAATVQRQLLQQLRQVVLVVNRENRVLFAEGDADSYVQFGTGELSAELPDVMEIARKGLKAKLRSSLRKVWNGQPTLQVEARVHRDGIFHQCELQFSKLAGRPDDDPAAMIIFSPVATRARMSSTPVSAKDDKPLTPSDAESKSLAAEQSVMELEHELMISREQLSSSIADLESANEELRAANEEALTMNEELQTSNEELETSKEELQSLNEELTTLNNQLEIKVDELEDTTNDLENLLTSSDIPTVFLDTQFRIRRYTPSCGDLFHFIAGDVGRPLSDIKAYFDDPDLLDDAAAVLRDLQPREKQVAGTNGDRRYRRRMLPYRTEENRIQGVVMTLTDITDLLNAQDQAHRQLAEIQAIYASTPVGLAFVDTELRYNSINERLAKINGVPVEAHLGKTIEDVLPTELAKLVSDNYRQVCDTGEGIYQHEITGKTRGSKHDHTYLVSYVPVVGESDEIVGVNTVVLDITDRKRAESELEDRERHLRRVIDNTLNFVGVLDEEGILLEANETALAAGGLRREDVCGKPFWECYWWAFDEQVVARLKQAVADARSGQIVRYDTEVRMANDSRMMIDFMLSPVIDDDGRVTNLIPSGVDISDKHAAQVGLRDHEERLRMALRAGGMAAWEWTPEKSNWEPHLYDILDLPQDVEASPEQLFKSVHAEDLPGLKEAWRQATEGNKDYYHEFRIRRSDGAVRWLVGTGKVTKDDQGGVDRIYGLNWDITERKRRESDLEFLADLQTAFNPLQGSDDLIRLACLRTAEYLELSHCCFVETDADATVADVIYDHVAGHAPSLVGRHAINDYHNPEEQQALINGQAVTINDVQHDVQDSKRRANFEALDIGAVCHIAFISDGRIKFTISSTKNQAHPWAADEIELLKNVTQRLCMRIERARAEKQLADAKDRLELSFEVGDVAPWSWDMRNNEIVGNPMLNRLFEFDEEATPSVEAFMERIDADDRQRVANAVQRSTEHGDQFDEQYTLSLPGGRQRHLRARGSVRTSGVSGKVLDFFGIIFDVTERVQQEKNLELIAALNVDLNSATASKEVAEMACKTIAVHRNLARCTLLKFHEDGETLSILHEYRAENQRGALAKMPVSDYLSQADMDLLRSNQPVIVSDMQAADYDAVLQTRHAAFGTAALVVVPYSAGGCLKFTLSVTRDTPFDWPPVDISLLQELCSLIYLRHQRAEAAEQLASSRQQLAMAMEAARMGSFWWDPETNECNWDDQWYDAVGVSRESKKTGTTFFELIHPDDVETVNEATRRTLEDGEKYQVEFRVRSHDGKTRWIAGNGRIIADDEGRKRLVGLNWDITDQKRAIEQIRLGEQRLRSAAEAAGFGMLHADLSTGVTTLSPELLHVVGLPADAPQTITSGETPEWVHPDDRQLFASFYEEILRQTSEGSKSIDHRIIRPDGELRWLHLLAKPVFSETRRKRKMRQIVGTVIDITERRQYEHSMEAARRAAEAANEAKSAFLANMSHEIRTPMTAILGYADLMSNLIEDQEALGYLQTIRRNGGFLLDIINDILDLSKIEADRMEIVLERFDPTGVLEEVRSILDVRASEKHLKLDVEYETKVPAEIESDPKLLRQILFNLVGNAIKFTNEGSVKVIVKYAEQHLSFTITDTGIGLTPSKRNKLFQPFSQGDHTVNREFGGTGLGLAISQRLATMLGGEISVESKEGKGSSFTVTVAVGDVDNSDLLHAKFSALPEVSEILTVDFELDCHVLVVDDRRDIRFLTSNILATAGATIEEAADGRLAIEAFCSSQENDSAFDIIILDMQMPRLDGYETARALRQLGFTGPIIALTADAMQGDMKKCIEAGCDDYLSKPIDAHRLLDLVNKLISS